MIHGLAVMISTPSTLCRLPDIFYGHVLNAGHQASHSRAVTGEMEHTAV